MDCARERRGSQSCGAAGGIAAKGTMEMTMPAVTKIREDQTAPKKERIQRRSMRNINSRTSPS